MKQESDKKWQDQRQEEEMKFLKINFEPEMQKINKNATLPPKKKKKKRGCQSKTNFSRQNTKAYEKNLLWDMKRKTKIA